MQRGDQRPLVAREPARLEDNLGRRGSAADRQRIEESPRRRREEINTCAKHGSEGQWFAASDPVCPPRSEPLVSEVADCLRLARHPDPVRRSARRVHAERLDERPFQNH